MPPFISLLIAALCGFALSFGGQGQLIVARMADGFADSDTHGRRPLPLLLIALVCAIATVVAAVVLAIMAEQEIEAAWHPALAGMALLVAVFDLFRRVSVNPVREPTRSMVAIGAVLVWINTLDAARAALFILALYTPAPWHVALGGAIGSAVSVWIGWRKGGDFASRVPIRFARWLIGAGLVLAAALIALNAYYAQI